MESRQPCPEDGHPRLLRAFTAGTDPRHSLAETVVPALPSENHTANITRLVFLTAAEEAPASSSQPKV